MKATKAQIKAALEANGGIIAKAADKLGMTYKGLYSRVSTDEELKAISQLEKEKMLDIAESELFTHIRAGNITAIIFFLKSYGKNRGYVESANYTFNANISGKNPFANLNEKELLKLAGLEDEKQEE